MKAIFPFLALTMLSSRLNSQWMDSFPGIPNMYVVGFEYYDDQLLAYGFGNPNVYTWTGSDWETWGAPFPGSNGLHNVEVIDNRLYAVGYFTGNSSQVFYEEDGQWIALGGEFRQTAGGNFSPSLYDIKVYRFEIYVCGEFQEVGGVPAKGIARWNGSAWQSVSDGFSGGMGGFDELISPHSMLVHNDQLYVFGNFVTVDNIEVNGIAAWNGIEWSGFDGGFNNAVYNGIEYKGSFYASGSFTESSSATNLSGFAKWNEALQSWEHPGLEFYRNNENPVYLHSLSEINGWLYFAGGFDVMQTDVSGPIDGGGIARWNGELIDPIYGGVAETAEAEALLQWEDGVLVGGNFTRAGELPINRIAWLSDEITQNPSVGIDDLNSPELWVQFNDQRTIEIKNTGNASFTQFGIFNLAGQIIDEGQPESNLIELYHLKAGVYLLQLRSDSQQKTVKIILE